MILNLSYFITLLFVVFYANFGVFKSKLIGPFVFGIDFFRHF